MTSFRRRNFLGGSAILVTLGALAVLVQAVIFSAVSFAQPGVNQVNNLRLWHSPDKTRVVFDVSSDVSHTVFSLENPQRLVVDIKNADLKISLPGLDPQNNHISAIRSGEPQPGVLRFVFELKRALEPNSFVLTPNELYGYRLVVDMLDQSVAQVVENPSKSAEKTVDNRPADPVSQQPLASAEPAVLENVSERRPQSHVQQKPQQMVVAIDAGHGGEDPGAIGYRGSHEKVITLSIAKRLKQIVDDDPRMRAVMIRTGDYYIKLHKRRELASAKGADIFVSIHADAFKRRSARGLSVFALSQSGATSTMARALADKENASDLIGGVSLSDKDEVLKKVLVDLSMTNTISESVNLGGRVLRELGQVGKLHSKRVEQAGFAVLKSPDMPSILVETGFITNPEEERKLRTQKYQTRIAKAIHSAISQYYDQTPYYSVASYSSPSLQNSGRSTASGTAPSRPKYHTVVRGDTLSTIAERYRVSLRELKNINNLRSNVAVLGKRLKLPAGAAQVTGGPAFHVIKRGDSLSKVSARYNVTIAALKALNNLKSDTVHLGQKIKLPAGINSGSVNEPRFHKVRRGDTLSEIAERYGSTEKKIMRANNMRNSTVMLGQTLKIPG